MALQIDTFEPMWAACLVAAATAGAAAGFAAPVQVVDPAQGALQFGEAMLGTQRQALALLSRPATRSASGRVLLTTSAVTLKGPNTPGGDVTLFAPLYNGDSAAGAAAEFCKQGGGRVSARGSAGKEGWGGGGGGCVCVLAAS
jgi:hypothetical protein